MKEIRLLLTLTAKSGLLKEDRYFINSPYEVSNIMKLTLETQRLILRPFKIEDAEAMFSGWANDPEVTKYLTWNTHKNLEETKVIINQWIKEYEKPERLNFAIVLKSQDKLIGGIDVVGYLNGVGGIPVIGYNLSRSF